MIYSYLPGIPNLSNNLKNVGTNEDRNVKVAFLNIGDNGELFTLHVGTFR